MNGVSIEQFLRFMFKTSNNQAEYEALLASLKLPNELAVRRLVIKGDSQLVISQTTGEFQDQELQLQQYLTKVKEIVEEFEEYTMKYIPRYQNSQSDLLSKLASTKIVANNRLVILEVIDEPSISGANPLDVCSTE